MPQVLHTLDLGLHISYGESHPSSLWYLRASPERTLLLGVVLAGCITSTPASYGVRLDIGVEQQKHQPCSIS